MGRVPAVLGAVPLPALPAHLPPQPARRAGRPTDDRRGQGRRPRIQGRRVGGPLPRPMAGVHGAGRGRVGRGRPHRCIPGRARFRGQGLLLVQHQLRRQPRQARAVLGSGWRRGRLHLRRGRPHVTRGARSAGERPGRDLGFGRRVHRRLQRRSRVRIFGGDGGSTGHGIGADEVGHRHGDTGSDHGRGQRRFRGHAGADRGHLRVREGQPRHEQRRGAGVPTRSDGDLPLPRRRDPGDDCVGQHRHFHRREHHPSCA